MAEIKKKTWPELFQKILEGKKNAEVRLADFDIKEGDTLVLEEYNPQTKKYTGRTIKKKVSNIKKIFHVPHLKRCGLFVDFLDAPKSKTLKLQPHSKECGFRFMDINKVNLIDFHTPEEIKKYGHYIIEIK